MIVHMPAPDAVSCCIRTKGHDGQCVVLVDLRRKR